MEVKATILTAVLCGLCGALGSPSMVDLSSQWRPDLGWTATCTWNLPGNDSLQSVRLYKAEQQFMIYRPERDGPKRSTLTRLTDTDQRVDCFESTEKGVTGKCEITLELNQPVTEDSSYTCEVSGERPFFRVDTKTVVIEALVPPSDALVEAVTRDQSSGRVTLNCTSSGLPAPSLVWTIGEQKVPHDFSGSTWSATSKLYHVWSSLSYTPVDSAHAVCTPETSRTGKIVTGHAAEYNSAGNISGSTAIIIFGIMTTLTFTR